MIHPHFKNIGTAVALLAAMVGVASAQEKLDRTVLPIQEPERPTYSELDVRNVETPPRFEVKAPENAPNVVIVLIDDIGFGGPSTFGGPIRTPTLDSLAANGLRYNNFHTTALCSPTRNALKTGRNHHTANTGSIMETATAFPGNTGQVPNSVAPLAEMLRLNGYSTGAFGKWHETAAWETSVSGPFDRWPTHQGFDKFYGFIGGETDQWYPLIYDGVTKVNPPPIENYHFTVDMTNQAINWVKAQQSMTPDKPFFVYYATGAVHAPHHVPKEWADKYKGQFDKGWDQVRQETVERQKQMGVIPANTQLADKPEDIKDWDTLPENQRRLFARQAEVFAGFLEQTDHEVGRLVDSTGGHRRAGQHPVHLHRRRQRHQRRGRLRRHVQRDDLLQRRDREGGRSHTVDRQVGRPGDLPAHGCRLGGCVRRTVLVDQAGGFGLRRHPQRRGHSLAEGNRGERWSSQPVLARHRCGAHHPGGGRPAGAQDRQRNAADSHRGGQHALHLQQRGGNGSAHHPVLRDVRQPRDLSRWLARPNPPPGAVADRPAEAVGFRHLGPLQRARGFQPQPTTWPPASPRS